MRSTLLPLALLIIAALYAAVGHGGASGYLALMALMGYPQEVMRPSALLLNLFVSGISFAQFARAGHFRWRLFWPFALTSIPLAFIGAGITLDPLIYKRVLGVCLLFAVARLFGLFGRQGADPRPVNLPLALFIGAALGLVSGIIGIGGGILLSPVLLLFRWADTKGTAAVSAPFIFVNSAAGLLGVLKVGEQPGADMLIWVGAALLGGLLGGHVGAVRLAEGRLKHVLATVLLLASVKLLFA